MLLSKIKCVISLTRHLAVDISSVYFFTNFTTFDKPRREVNRIFSDTSKCKTFHDLYTKENL